MNTTTTNIRFERIQKLLRELEYEVTRGMLEQEISEEINFSFYVPGSRKIPNGTIFCEFRTGPIQGYKTMNQNNLEPRLKIVK